jgi:hypothetical protein
VADGREGDAVSNDNERGLYRKYDVKRTDGSSEPGGKHERCAYFVLDLEHDEFALPALIAYAGAAHKTHPALAADIMKIVRAEADKQSARCNCREAACPHALFQAFTRGASDTAHEIMNDASEETP